jgi:hypothetical protein
MEYKKHLPKFVEESNRIEGISEVRETDLTVHEEFLERAVVTVPVLEELVGVLQPGAVLRARRGLDVRVGDHLPPPGGPWVAGALESLLQTLETSPYAIHVQYETLHPFTDANGRSGRALWAWQMLRLGHDLRHGFLHQFYYQALEARRG